MKNTITIEIDANEARMLQIAIMDHPWPMSAAEHKQAVAVLAKIKQAAQHAAQCATSATQTPASDAGKGV